MTNIWFVIYTKFNNVIMCIHTLWMKSFLDIIHFNKNNDEPILILLEKAYIHSTKDGLSDQYKFHWRFNIETHSCHWCLFKKKICSKYLLILFVVKSTFWVCIFLFEIQLKKNSIFFLSPSSLIFFFYLRFYPSSHRACIYTYVLFMSKEYTMF